MAIIHQATITPTKQEIVESILDSPVEIVGTYRFDDPDGEVGVEGFLLRREDELRHAVLTYRGAPLEGAGARLVCTMEHSTLGRRWVYDGATDPVAVACFRRALLGQQEEAALEIWGDGKLIGTREPTARLALVMGTVPSQGSVRIVRALDGSADVVNAPALVASWAGGEAVIAELATRSG